MEETITYTCKACGGSCKKDDLNCPCCYQPFRFDSPIIDKVSQTQYINKPEEK